MSKHLGDSQFPFCEAGLYNMLIMFIFVHIYYFLRGKLVKCITAVAEEFGATRNEGNCRPKMSILCLLITISSLLSLMGE